MKSLAPCVDYDAAFFFFSHKVCSTGALVHEAASSARLGITNYRGNASFAASFALLVYTVSVSMLRVPYLLCA